MSLRRAVVLVLKDKAEIVEHARFELAIEHDDKTLRVAPPVILPAAPVVRRPPMALDARLARARLVAAERRHARRWTAADRCRAG